MKQLKNIKLIVTHYSPDLDAVGAIWLFKKFDEQEFSDAGYTFVNPGDQISDQEFEKRKLKRNQVVHVDTGLGEFDHHHDSAESNDSATKRVFNYLKSKYKDLATNEPLKRIMDLITQIDHFGEIDWPEPNHDRYIFFLEPIIKAIKQKNEIDDQKVVEFALLALDGVYIEMERKVDAEREMGQGIEFTTRWGKGIGFETSNDAIIKVCLKSGYSLVVRKDPDLGNIRIKALPRKGIDLSEVHDKIIALDKQGSWYLHSSKTMLLNGSSKHRDQKPSSLNLKQVIDILKQAK